jgi:hypothetical protein
VDSYSSVVEHASLLEYGTVVTGQLVPDILKDCGAFNLQVMQFNLFFPHFAILPPHRTSNAT